MEKLIHKPGGELIHEDAFYIGRVVWYDGKHRCVISEPRRGYESDLGLGQVWVKFDNKDYWGPHPMTTGKKTLAFEEGGPRWKS